MLRLSCSLALAALLSVVSWLAVAELPSAFDDLLRKAEAGDVSAQFAVGSAYDTGRGAPRNAAEAMKWYRKAADAGYAEAQNSVGSGFQAERRYSEALHWYELASKQGHALATNNLAYLYDLGLGVPQDRRLAADLYLQSANLAWPEAMWNLANMYGAGQLGPTDLETACVWTLRARRFATRVNTELRIRIDAVVPRLERALSPGQWASCQQAGENWSPQPAPK